MKTQKKKKIIFVCTGNTCRSPMAELIFKEKITQLGLTVLQISSAGLQVDKKSKMNEKTAQVLMEKGFQPLSFTSKQITEKMLVQSLAVVCMTDVQRDILMDMRWKALSAVGEENIENNVYSFRDVVGYEIVDPYGKDIECYRYVYELIAGGMSALIDKILPQEIRKKYVPRPRKKKTENQMQKGEK